MTEQQRTARREKSRRPGLRAALPLALAAALLGLAVLVPVHLGGALVWAARAGAIAPPAIARSGAARMMRGPARRAAFRGSLPSGIRHATDRNPCRADAFPAPW